jgi:3-deoxy-manno-octulosonate cytidylyltransferase (CMP-KDO synthetase)
VPRIVIPARYGSTRLPGKPLVMLAGMTMIERVWRQASAAGVGGVIIATDDERIIEVARGFGAEVRLTGRDHASGTDRLAEVARAERWPDEEIIVNVQGDEPLLPPANVAQVAALLAADAGAAMATLSTPLDSTEEFRDPNVVKVVAARGRALYFSRSPLPWHRSVSRGGPESLHPWSGAARHVGLYAYRAGVLKRLASLAPTPLECSERLEQLRVLESGMAIAIATAAAVPGPGVDTPEDVERVSASLAARFP